jgi:hypothetical protein
MMKKEFVFSVIDIVMKVFITSVGLKKQHCGGAGAV